MMHQVILISFYDSFAIVILQGFVENFVYTMGSEEKSTVFSQDYGFISTCYRNKRSYLK